MGYFLTNAPILWMNLVILIIFGLFTYDKYAKRWTATTGQYHVNGRITWSEMGTSLTQHTGKQQALISYSYHVNGQLFNGEMDTGLYPEKLIKAYPRGKPVIIYYSPKEPSFSNVDAPSSLFNLLVKTIGSFFILPIILINGVVFFFYPMINA